MKNREFPATIGTYCLLYSHTTAGIFANSLCIERNKDNVRTWSDDIFAERKRKGEKEMDENNVEVENVGKR